MNNTAENSQITMILTIVLGVMVVILVTLVFIYLILKIKEKAKKKQEIKSNQQTTVNDNKRKQQATGLERQSIFDFMEFEKIEDNMIVVKKRKKYLMVVECKGVNYDLMSEIEKIGVEDGFQQFLNTLRHPIQIYIQTRTIDLENSINRYKRKIKNIEVEYKAKQYEYNKLREDPTVSRKRLEKANFELTRQRNLLEYGKDLVSNTEKMSLNRSVLNKKYYLVIPYYVEDVGSDKYYESELSSMAFSELYTRAQALISTLSSCYVTGKILNSRQIMELLYVAYNRDDAEMMGIDKMLSGGYESLYSTSIDVLEKKSMVLDDEIKRKAVAIANKSIDKAKSQIQKEVEAKEKSVEELARKMAEVILEKNKRTE